MKAPDLHSHKPGDQVVVYVPWQAHDRTVPARPYWDGVVVRRIPATRGPTGHPVQYVVRHTYPAAGGVPPTDDSVWAARWVYPARMRGRVRIYGRGGRARLVAA